MSQTETNQQSTSAPAGGLPAAPVFILGSPRSGTSVLHWALLQHAELWGSEESEFLLPIAQAIKPAFARGMQYAPHSWLQQQQVSLDEFAVTIGSGLAALYASRAHGKRWLEQTPSYSTVALELARMFPAAQFLHIVRDGRQVCDSMRRKWGWDIDKAASHWVDHVAAVLKLEREMPQRVMRIYYEELITEPAAACTVIFSFLNLADNHAAAEFVRSSPINAAPGTETQDHLQKLEPRWHDWPLDDLHLFHHIAGDLLLTLGYQSELRSDTRISATAWRKRGRIIDIDGIDIDGNAVAGVANDGMHLFLQQSHQHDQNRSRSLLLIHGFPTASWDWHRIWNGCRQQFERLVAIDMPGFGYSGKPKQLPYSIAMQADVHEQLLAQLDIKSCHLLVHDYGVSVAQELLARQLQGTLPFAIESCIFLNGGLFHGVHRPLLIQKLLASPAGFMLSPLISKSMFARSMRKIFFHPPDAKDIEWDIEWDIEQMWRLINHQRGQRLTHKVMRYMHERKRHYQRWLQALQQAAIPLHLIVGEDDPISGANIAAAWSELISPDNITTLANTGHYPQLENPQALISTCIDFWDSI